ncbi:hypothetical protein R6Q57_018687 [Mikania cordata]
MPELPEVEAARKAIAENCVGKKIKRSVVADDAKVINGVSRFDFEASLTGKTIVGAYRKGKNMWIQLDSPPFPSFHFGLSGAIHIKGVSVTKYKRFAVNDTDKWPSKYSKLFIELDDGLEVLFTDKIRFARVRLLENPATMPPISELGPDALLEAMSEDELFKALSKKKTAIKALLLNQSFISGVGNWIADEVLYQNPNPKSGWIMGRPLCNSGIRAQAGKHNVKKARFKPRRNATDSSFSTRPRTMCSGDDFAFKIGQGGATRGHGGLAHSSAGVGSGPWRNRKTITRGMEKLEIGQNSSNGKGRFNSFSVNKFAALGIKHDFDKKQNSDMFDNHYMKRETVCFSCQNVGHKAANCPSKSRYTFPLDSQNPTDFLVKGTEYGKWKDFWVVDHSF